jgi:CrcB protein
VAAAPEPGRTAAGAEAAVAPPGTVVGMTPSATDLGAVAAGGVLGALARYVVSVAWPVPAAGFPWTTWAINVTGCLLLGALMVVAGRSHRLVRPFLGVGVLGGYTTFSAYAVEVVRLADGGAPLLALAYLVLTLVGAVLAVWAGAALARKAIRS